MHTSPASMTMSPGPGQRLQRFVGDCVQFGLRAEGLVPKQGWVARLRTNLGRAEVLRQEILQAHTRGVPQGGEAWRDLPMRLDGDAWNLELPLAEPGFFKAKPYLLDPRGWQHWPHGEDIGITVHPDCYRSANVIYCAFTRMFGPTRTLASSADRQFEQATKPLDARGYSVIPPSGKLRDLARFLPHITDTLKCRVLHLLPVHPTPTTFARFGRFGSPYAALDLTAIDPALVEFDKRKTGIDQFRELTFAAHLRDMRVFLDIVINHTGWGSVLQENHPEWFVRDNKGLFVSPGAWGNTWEDLVELKHNNVSLWDELARVFLTWCQRGVDGFRCDAGYKVPVAAWQYIIAKVQQQYPRTIFLLEGLGGAWEATEALLTDGGMQWAYSELFQNYSGSEVNGYLDHSLGQSARVGLLVHYSETHDNARLAARGRHWSLLRNRLCGLASVSGGFGFTCGVEWLADEKINVHHSTGMRWDAAENIVPELARLNQLISDHPCFFDGAVIQRLSDFHSHVLALSRVSRDGQDQVLVLVNTDIEAAQTVAVELPRQASPFPVWSDLLGQELPLGAKVGSKWQFTLGPGAAYCLAPSSEPRGLHGEDYRRARARAAFAFQALCEAVPAEMLPHLDWLELAALVERSPENFLAVAANLGQRFHEKQLTPPVTVAVLRDLWEAAAKGEFLPQVVHWDLEDVRRVTLVPPGHWLLVTDSKRFRANLTIRGGAARNVESILASGAHVAFFCPVEGSGPGQLLLERYTETQTHTSGSLQFLPEQPGVFLEFESLVQKQQSNHGAAGSSEIPSPSDIVLLTNGRGAMARFCLDLGRVNSKYDCLLGANLHPTLPVDRHVLAKRLRVWVNADGFISPLMFRRLDAFRNGNPAVFDFVADAGDGRTVQIQMRASMIAGRNTTVFEFSRPTAAKALGKQLPPEADVRLTVRVDIEDRGYHSETRRNGGADHHFNSNTRFLNRGPEGPIGFVFSPAADRTLEVFADAGDYHMQPEWSEHIPHPIEATRGQVPEGDGYSPGWFELPLPKGACRTLVLDAEPGTLSIKETRTLLEIGERDVPAGFRGDPFAAQLYRAAQQFVVRRDSGRTVIAGYPWFLDWGRDTFISARGLLAAGMLDEVKQMLLTFARFEKDGTLPNTIFGADASNRDTSDAPLWFAVVCEELAALAGPSLYTERTGKGTETLAETLWSIALNYAKGTPNGIRMDLASGLIWSPSHFTWMDTNYPACTPREGYPVEIQALWIRLLRQLEKLGGPQSHALPCGDLAKRVLDTIEKKFWLENKGWYSDLLVAARGQSAADAQVDDALRSNCLFLISLGLVGGARAKRCVMSAMRHLVVPGALRSLAPLSVNRPLPNLGNQGQPLNDPHNPYWGKYEGDEDTRRKPAYHNGTAWTWSFPTCCEALARVWDFSPPALEAARAYLGSMAGLLSHGCIGHIPEVVDGDAPHTERGCDAQAWSATEALRVWKLLQSQSPPG